MADMRGVLDRPGIEREERVVARRAGSHILPVRLETTDVVDPCEEEL